MSFKVLFLNRIKIILLKILRQVWAVELWTLNEYSSSRRHVLPTISPKVSEWFCRHPSDWVFLNIGSLYIEWILEMIKFETSSMFFQTAFRLASDTLTQYIRKEDKTAFLSVGGKKLYYNELNWRLPVPLTPLNGGSRAVTMKSCQQAHTQWVHSNPFRCGAAASWITASVAVSPSRKTRKRQLNYVSDIFWTNLASLMVCY